MKVYIVYKIIMFDDSYYIGVTSNINRRLDKHSQTKNIKDMDILFSSFNKEIAYCKEDMYIRGSINDSCCDNFSFAGIHPSIKDRYKSKKQLDKIMNSCCYDVNNLDCATREYATKIVEFLYK